MEEPDRSASRSAADGRSPCPLPRSLAPYYEYLLQYLPRMGVDLRVLDLTLATRNDETRRLDEGELLSTRLATEIAPAAAVVARLGARPVPPHAAKGAKTSTTRS